MPRPSRLHRKSLQHESMHLVLASSRPSSSKRPPSISDVSMGKMDGCQIGCIQHGSGCTIRFLFPSTQYSPDTTYFSHSCQNVAGTWHFLPRYHCQHSHGCQRALESPED
jgi:hypothetical protein